MFDPVAFANRTILVTGASSGLGRAAAILLSGLGAKIIAAGRSEERLIDTAGQLAGTGHRVNVFDLSAVDEICGWLKMLTSEHGPLHGLVHSAGLHLARPLQMLKPDAVQDLMKVNVVAGLMLAKAFRQRDVFATPASLVFLSSVMGEVGESGVSGYCATKGAVNAMTRSLALELAPLGIRVNAVAPGQVESELWAQQQKTLTHEQVERIRAKHPLGLGRPEDVAHAVAFLLSDASRWITGSTLVVDGGYTSH